MADEDLRAPIDEEGRVSQKLAQMIVDEALAAGFKFRPGHHRSTSTAVLARMIEAAAAAFVETHMRRGEE